MAKWFSLRCWRADSLKSNALVNEHIHAEPVRLEDVDYVLRKAMAGQLRIPCSIILAAGEVKTNGKQSMGIWRIQRVALEAADQTEAIDLSRKSVLEGARPLGASTFDVTKDTWECYVATQINSATIRLCIEILVPYDYADYGTVLNVTPMKCSTNLMTSDNESWLFDCHTLNLSCEQE